ncbi:hypothetical protein HOLleu_02227 [Holothuria leucospilota]|uniref:Uncharacterized protein n=1 Tax=Holothuria leucospilota TaxID=206669 RepID=A0A9Q1CQE6_HOLLE|nr:hypothetical protein HOLleu_02227 [Holothuria leucospilota]
MVDRISPTPLSEKRMKTSQKLSHGAFTTCWGQNACFQIRGKSETIYKRFSNVSNSLVQTYTLETKEKRQTAFKKLPASHLSSQGCQQPFIV